MFILIDHADAYSTAKPLEWPPIDGVTTVPTILHREDKELLGVRHLIQHLPARRVPRRGRFPRHGENGGTRRTRTKHAYSWSLLRPLGVIWGHSRSMWVSRPRERRKFSKFSAHAA